MKTVNKALTIITAALLALLIGVVIQLLFAFGTVDLYAFNWIQWFLEVSYLLLCISIGLRVSLSMLIDDEELSVGPVESVTAELEEAINYITLLEKHIYHNDGEYQDQPYVPYDSTELELQVKEFKNKHYDNRR